MQWPWGSKITEIQAMQLGKFLLTLCHAAIIGSVGYLFISQADPSKKMFVAVIGILISFFLFMLAMRVLREVKEDR